MSDIPTVIGVTGYATNGKDTIAEILVRDFGYERIAFADTLKSMALVLNPIVYVNQGGARDGADQEVRLATLVHDKGWDTAKTYPEVRRFLQVLGTEAVREHLGNDIWVTTALNKMREGQRYVVSDVRFPNEEKAIHNLPDAEVWRVIRPGFGIGLGHPSESFIKELSVDFEVVNDSSIDDLARKVQTYLSTRKVVDASGVAPYAPRRP